MGKTSFARSTSVAMAEKGYKIGYFSLELNRNEWFGRASNIRSAEEIENLTIDILDEVPKSADEIEANSIDKGYDLLIIDYLQLVDRGEGSLEDVIKAIRSLADKLCIPVFVLSQLTRNIETRDIRLPIQRGMSVRLWHPRLLPEVRHRISLSRSFQRREEERLQLKLPKRMRILKKMHAR